MRYAVFAALWLFLQAADTPTATEQQLWRHRNLGKAFYENPTTQTQAVDEFKKALTLAPSSMREQVNYGLALLRAGKTREGVAELEKVQKSHPELPHTWFNLGIVFKKEGEFEKALPQFERMVQLTPKEPVAHYNLGVLYKQISRFDDAVKQFHMAAELNHMLAAPHFQLYNVYRTNGRKEEAANELREFQRLKKAQEGAAIPEDMEWCDYAEIYDPLDAPPPGAEPKLEFQMHRFAEKADGWIVLDAFGEGRADVVAWSGGKLKLYRHGTDAVANSGLEDVAGVISAAQGDFDNDGLMDLCILTAKGPLLYRNTKGQFARHQAELPAKRFDAAVWLDYDHDYDLDLFLLGPEPVLMRNQGTAGFADHTADFPFVKGTRDRRLRSSGWSPTPRASISPWRIRTAAECCTAICWVGSTPPRISTSGARLESAARGMPVRFDLDGRRPPGSGCRGGRPTQRHETQSPTTSPSGWMGVKNLKLGQGSEVEVKAGTLYQKKTIRACR